MMQTKRISIWTIALVGLMTVTSAAQAKDYSFEYNGLYYQIFAQFASNVVYGVKVVPESTVPPFYPSGKRPKGDIIISDFIYGERRFIVRAIEGRAFDSCNGITSVTISADVTSIGNCAFYNCGGLKSISISGSVQTIGNFAFTLCKSLTSVSIPKGVQKIGNYVFASCEALQTIDMPSSIKEIGERAFTECKGLKTVTVHWDAPLDVPDNIFENVNTANVTLKVPKGKEAAYKAHAVWGKLNVVESTANEVIDDLRIYAADGALRLALPAPETVHIYNVEGSLVKTLILPAGDHVQPLPSGVYVVRVGERVTKVMVK